MDLDEIYDTFLYDCHVANKRLSAEDWLFFGREVHHVNVPNRDGGVLCPLNSLPLTMYQHWVAGVLQSELLQKCCFAFVRAGVLPPWLDSLRAKWAPGESSGAKAGGRSTYNKRVGLFKQTKEELAAARRKADKRRPVILTHPNGEEEWFPSVTEAAATRDLSRPHLCAVMKAKRNHHKGYTCRLA